MRPRVVILSAFATPFRSGAEACSEEVARELQQQFECVILTGRLRRSLPACERLPGGVLLKRLGFGCGFDRFLFPFLAPLAARKLHPKLVHAVLESFAGLALVFCRFVMPHVPRLLTLQSTNTNLLLGPMHKAADRITAISTTLVERAGTFGRNDVVLIPNGIDLPAIREAVGHYPKQTGRVVYVGRLEHMKGVDTLLRAFARLIEIGNGSLPPRVDLHIVGDGSKRLWLEELAKHLGMESRVRFLGYLSSSALFREFAQAEVFCGLSRSEAMGNVFLEAQAAGCAVLATKVGGIPDIVHDEETGILIPPDDPNVAASHLKALLTDTHLRHRLANAGKEHAAAYDWSGIAKRYSEVYGDLLAQSLL